MFGFRAVFSEITAQSASRALNNLGQPNERVHKAVEVRTELDLRIGESASSCHRKDVSRPNITSNTLCLVAY